MTRAVLESGLRKYEIIAPLLNEGLEAAEKRRIRNEILVRHAISERTLRRYLEEYRTKGYEGAFSNSRKAQKVPARPFPATYWRRRSNCGANCPTAAYAASLPFWKAKAT